MSDRLVPRPHYSARSIRFGSRDPGARVRLEYVTEMHWPRRPGKTPYRENAVRGLGTPQTVPQTRG